KYSFLLESVEGEEKIARFSFLARDPELILETKHNSAKITDFKGKKPQVTKKTIEDSPLTYIRQIMARYRFVNLDGLPRFCGGMVGFLSYDTVRFFEKLPDLTKDDLKLPDTLLVLAKDLIIFDHLNHKMKIVSCAEVDPKASAQKKAKAYQDALKRIDQTIADLQKPLKQAKRKISGKLTKLKAKSNFTEAQFKTIVDKAKKEIRAGEIIQVVLSQRFEVNIKVDALEIYRALRALNPSPYMYLLNLNGTEIVGSSPELLVRCEDGVVETRPIAGTRWRGKSDEEDDRLAEELLNDPKEKAEHIMLVDLGRNDLGRVCQKGTVHLSEFMEIERYSHVMHIISNVKGRLAKDKDDFDVLQAAFPAGTVSGAPKIRAMEIIDELENVRRGIYAGCIGYFNYNGDFDTCISIRTMIMQDGVCHLQAGAGIVFDSVPDKECEEVANKVRGMLKAVRFARRGLT
ncbi:MAG: anthranilate synthase component I, partial [Bacteroidetes bacterium]|nr:anthranilate synthase component I [Bacteroidota bacterium]